MIKWYTVHDRIVHDLSSLVPAEGMRTERQFGKRMIIAHQTDRFAVTDLRYGLDARTSLADTETVARKYLSVTLRMQFREALTELKLLAVNAQRTVSALLALHGICRKAIRIYTKEITHARTF